ncbi:MAG TPA: sensor histidine kinase [Gammaproteobacteria bacterium]|nr:sensor histidine kinase [Gammaproteobacteria bacterium]
MLSDWVILTVAAGYLGTLFGIAYYGDKRADAGRSVIANPYIYTLSIAVYCTAWTFYGSVGRAVTTGVGFLPIYLGPTLMAAGWWLVLRKIIRISKAHRITSIADFIASRYGKSALLGGLVTFIAVIGILPYISLQLKAVSTSYLVVKHYPDLVMPGRSVEALWQDTALYVALLMAAFTILFGTRHIDATERHEGMVAAIAVESMVKLTAFVTVGAFVTFGVYDGLGDIFTRAAGNPRLAAMMTLEGTDPANWLTLTFLSMLAIIFLPRQFQVAVVENVNESHVRKAVWLFPLYLLIINLFVLPLAFGGVLHFPAGVVDPDTFVLTLPMAERQSALTLFVFIGGLSAATGMLIVATIALSTMVCNDLMMPALLRIPVLGLSGRKDLTGLLLGIRRGTIVLVLLLGYSYFRLIGESYALVTIGLVSFCAAAQFAPAILLGIYWKGATRVGAVAGLSGGFLVWAYSLLLPAFARSGWIPISFVEQGPFGIELLKPYALFGLQGLDLITHSVLWSMLVNVALLVGGSLLSRQSVVERVQSNLFVDVFRSEHATQEALFWRGTATVSELKRLVARFVGERRADADFAAHAQRHGESLDELRRADPGLVAYAERLLAGAIGASSARVMVSTVMQGEAPGIEEVMEILDETSQVREYSHRLEQKSRELERATEELRAANERLKELDQMKDDFVSMVSHELRTPLTSIRAFTEILRDNPDVDSTQRQEFLGVVAKETERLSRLVNDVLDLTKIESGRMEWNRERADLRPVLDAAVSAVSHLFEQRGIELVTEHPNAPAIGIVDADRITQVIINLLSNAAKFCKPNEGKIVVRLTAHEDGLYVAVIDNGRGIPPDNVPHVFDKFYQAGGDPQEKPGGSGLGLTICERIVRHHGGRIWVESELGRGTTVTFVLPSVDAAEKAASA